MIDNMADGIRLFDTYTFSARTPGYTTQGLLATRRYGRIAALCAVLLIPYFIWQDLALVGVGFFVPARILCLAAFILSGLVLWLRKRLDRLGHLVHGLALASLMAMGCHMFFKVILYLATDDNHKALAANTLVLLLFACFLFAGGLRLYLPLITGIPLAALVAALGARGSLDGSALVWLSNPLVILVVVNVMAVVQERGSQREYRSFSLAEMRLDQLCAFLDAITESAFMLDVQGRVVFANRTWAQRMGLSLSEVLGKPVWDLLPPVVRAHRRLMFDQVVRTGQAKRFEDVREGMCFDQVIYPVKNSAGEVRFLAVFGKDISDQKKVQDQLVYEALHDPLTGLANRRTLFTRLAQAISRARRGYSSCLLFIDLDHFKEANDNNDHATGDRLLKELTKLLLAGERDHDAVFRMGGDEFAILVEGASLEDGRTVAERLRGTVEACDFSGLMAHPVAITLSIGCVLVDAKSSIDGVIQQADEAMYRAKHAGRNRVETGSPGPDADRKGA